MAIAQPDESPTKPLTKTLPVPTGLGFRGTHQKLPWSPSPATWSPSKSDREPVISGGEAVAWKALIVAWWDRSGAGGRRSHAETGKQWWADLPL